MNPWEAKKHRAPQRASLVWHTGRRWLKNWFSRLLGRRPRGESTSAEEWTTVSVRLANLGQHEEALACCDRGLKIGPRDSALWWNKSVALANLGRHEESLACCERGLEINPRHSGLWNNQGAALAALGRHEESLACCERGLEINPRDSALWYNKGTALRALGRIREAEECLQRAEELAAGSLPSGRAPVHPLEASEHRTPERASLVRNVLAFRDQLDPWLPFPQNACCFGFGEDSLPLPLGALLLLWERWPRITGPCPVCGGQWYGVGFLGFLVLGWIPGVCIECERSLKRNVSGAGWLANEIRPILKGSPYYLNRGVMWGTIEGLRAPLVAALQSLGARDLPDEAWAREREGGGAGMTIRTDDGGSVNLRVEVDAGHPVTHDATGGRLLPTTKLSVEAAPEVGARRAGRSFRVFLRRALRKLCPRVGRSRW